MLRCLLLLIVIHSVLSAQTQTDSLMYRFWGKKAWKEWIKLENATVADDKTCFSDIDSLRIYIALDGAAKEIISNQRAKDKLQLTLRRHGVPLSDSSGHALFFSINALRNPRTNQIIYQVDVSLYQSIIFYRKGTPYQRHVDLWEEDVFGYAGSLVAEKTFLDIIEEKAERVANLYLSANVTRNQKHSRWQELVRQHGVEWGLDPETGEVVDWERYQAALQRFSPDSPP